MDPGLAIIWYAVLLVALTCHEAAHAFAALKLGDPTAYHGGQVTLDPIPHIKREPFGMIALPILSFLFFGWMIGWASTPYDPYWARTNRRKAALMSMAGPAANLILLIIAAVAIRVGIGMGIFSQPTIVTFEQVATAPPGGFANSAAAVVSIMFSLNLILLVFNLMPLPPLDGSGILPFFLSDRSAERYTEAISRPNFRIFGLIIAWNLIDAILPPVHLFAVKLLYPGAGFQL